jgi:muramoyltetrapeptide carboxypeptidase
MFADPSIRAIMCAKAGYGSGRVIPLLNHSVISRHPKIFVGYSDITLLLSYFLSCAQTVTFHGPVVAGELYHGMSRQTASQLYDLLTGVEVPYPLLTHVEVIRRGSAEGRLMGGNLSRIIETLGTFYELHLQDSILFVEDTDICLEDLDTMLVHLHTAGKLRSLRGIVIGMLREEGGRRLDAEAIGSLCDGLLRRRIPIVRSPKCGHGRLNLTLPLGAHVKITTSSRKVMLLESPVHRG